MGQMHNHFAGKINVKDIVNPGMGQPLETRDDKDRSVKFEDDGTVKLYYANTHLTFSMDRLLSMYLLHKLKETEK